MRTLINSINNNATTVTVDEPVTKNKRGTPKGRNRKRCYAVSDENVMDKSNPVLGDGVDIELHPNAHQSDFESEESEYDEEEDCLGKDEEMGNQGASISMNPETEDKEPSTQEATEDDFDTLFENEKVQRLFNLMFDRKLQAQLKEHQL